MKFKSLVFWICVHVLVDQVAGSEWQAGHRFRWREATTAAGGKTGFTLVPASSTGITFTNGLSQESAAKNRILENGSGVALGDVDGDGRCDIYFCRLEGANVLYRNLGGWKFEDITAAAGTACAEQFSTGAAFADVDGDGDLDLLVNAIGGGTRLFINNGRAAFSEAKDSGLDRTLGSSSMSLSDFDGDGDLDLYVANYRTTTIKDSPPGVKPEARQVNGKIVVTPEDRFTALKAQAGGVMLIERGEPDIFYLNDGKGRFTAVSWTAGVFVDESGKALPEPPRDWGLSVLFRDFNGDGLPDLYVCNDFFMSPDQLWLNESGKRFRPIAKTSWRNMSMSSMTVDVADINRDGHDDFFVADMLSRDHSSRHRQRANGQRLREFPPAFHDPDSRPEVIRNTLYLNRGENSYAEIAQFSGVAATEWTWSAVFMDVDLDGYEDLLLTTGNMHDVIDADTLKAIAAPSSDDAGTRHLKNLLKFPPILVPNLCYRNKGDLTFEEVGEQWGFNLRGISHGMALADLDQDGDSDVVVNNLNAPAAIYRNDTATPRVAIRLKGKAPNSHGIGARISVEGGPVKQSQAIVCGGRYLSSDEAIRTFAAGSATDTLRVEVRWRSGQRSVITNVGPNRIYEIAEEGSTPPENKVPSKPQPWFEDVSHLLSHRHLDEPFDDFEKQPLLPRRLSTLGPAVAWFDVNGDGHDELIIGAGKSGKMAVFRNHGKGTFEPWQSGALSTPEVRDQAGLLGWRKENGEILILAASANYEDATTNGAMLRIFNLNATNAVDGFRARTASPGPLAMADIDNDGDLDLFLGGRVLPRGYPEPVSSIIFRNEEGRFRPDVENSKGLGQIGLVSGAVFTDFDADGDPDLLLACEWGPVRLLRNDKGLLTDQTDAFGLAKFTGLWNGVTAGDFDNDGKLDFAASNWGRNTKYPSQPDEATRVYWGNVSQRGGFDVLEAAYDSGLKKFVPWAGFDVVSSAMPFIQEHVTSFRSYGELSVEEILGPRANAVKQARVATLDSTVFLNRGNHFEARPLPAEAQFAPAFSVVAADADGDGNEDLFLTQNFFDVEPETSRADAGLGLWLKGNGNGGFKSVPASGILMEGQGRGAALCDFNADGKVDLAAAQNRGQTKLFLNKSARAGLRVRLNGPPGNPFGIGASMRLENDTLKGPLREIHAGSGYWSQDSAVQILNLGAVPSQLVVRWPGGRRVTIPVKAGASEIALGFQGDIKVFP